MKRSSEYLDENGPFNNLLDGFSIRQGQLDLCDAIETIIENNEVLVAEAGTGIGKTFAYLIPALLSGKKIIISTGTKHLQDQLFHTDVPRVLEALEITVKTALLKGRSNYLCLHRLELAPHLGFLNKESQSLLHHVKVWSGETGSGDISELSSVPEDAYIWSLVISTADNCLGGECDHWNDCFIVKARKQAQDANVLIINHHLLMADMTLKGDGFAELLPSAEAFVIDEAHQLHAVASHFFGDTVSSRQIIALSKDAIAEHINEAPDMPEIREHAELVETTARDFRIALGDSGVRQAWVRVKNKPAIVAARENLLTALNDLSETLKAAAERSRGLDQCYQRCLKQVSRLERFSGVSHGQNESDDNSDEKAAILWYETYAKSFMLHATPIDVASLFRKHTNDFSSAWVFTSATLQVNKKFTHFVNSMGLDNYKSDIWESPFDYKKQSMLYLPENLPEPADYAYTRELINKVLPVLKSSEGRAFLLFTSYRAMNEAAELLRDTIEYPLFMQGELAKHRLLARFRETPNAVLLGTSSFWEGVDVRGSALSCVVIDKLPFASPGDPVMQARIDAIRKSGGQPFMDYQVPQAVIALKQGVGRLIRDINDYGVVVIGDPRLKQKSYGKHFLNSLPAMRVTRKLGDVESFFSERCAETDFETACN